MIESTATSWKEKQSNSPSVSSKSRSVSWADQRGNGAGATASSPPKPPVADGDAVNIPAGQLMPEITFVRDQSHTVNLKAAAATTAAATHFMALARGAAAHEGEDANAAAAAPPPPLSGGNAASEETTTNVAQMQRLSENLRRLRDLRTGRAGGDAAGANPPAGGRAEAAAAGRVNEDEAAREFKMGMSYFLEQDYFNAKTCFLSCLKKRFEILGQDHVDVCLCQERLGDSMVRLGQVEEAHWQYLQALRGLQARLGPQSEHATRIMLSVGDLYFNSGCYGRALKYYEKSLRYRLELLGEEHSSVHESIRRAVQVHRALAHAASEKREHEMTLFHHREVLWLSRFASKRGSVTCNVSVGTAKGGLGIDSIMDAVSFDAGEGSVNDEGGKEQVNFSYLEESRRLLNAKGSRGTDEDVANVLGTIASIHHKKNELENARKCYMERLVFMKNALPGNAADIADTLFSLGVVCSSAGKHRLAIGHLAESAKMFAHIEEKGSEKVAAVLRQLCSSCLGARDLSLALQYYGNYSEICSRTDGVEVLTVMGIIHCKRYDLRNAIDCFIEALKIEATQCGGEGIDNDLAPMIENLQGIFLTPKKFKHGTYYCYEKARDCEDMKIILQNLGLAQLKRRNTAEAERYLNELVTNLNEDNRMERVDFVRVLFCMGNVLFRRCQYHESKLYYEQCLQSDLDTVHRTDRVELLANMGTAYLKIGEPEKSSSHFKRALQELEKGTRDTTCAFAFDDGITMKNFIGLLNRTKSGVQTDSVKKEAFILRHLIGLNLCKELRFDEAVRIFEELKRQKSSRDSSDEYFDVIQVSVDISNTYMMKGHMKTSRLMYDSAMRSIRKARVPDMHPFMTQVQRLHKLHHPTGEHAPRQFSLLFK